MSDPPRLLQHCEKLLPQACHAHLVAACPTMDLIAVVSQDESLHVYRFGGQRAFGLAARGGGGAKAGRVSVRSLGWRFDGQYLAVGWSDGSVEVVSAETGNVLLHFKQPALGGKKKASADGGKDNGVSCVGWGLNFINVEAVKRKVLAKGDTRTSDDWFETQEQSSLDDFLERIPDPKKVGIPLDLPDQLARLDITSSLPKLPALPLLPPAAYHGGEHPAAELFSSQIALDAALGVGKTKSVDGLEALLLAQEDGQVRLILYDLLGVGNLPRPVEWAGLRYTVRTCASHPFSSTYMFLAEVHSDSGDERTALIPLSLRFLRSSGSQSHMIESKTAQLEILVQYIGECLLALSHHWNEAKKIPRRFQDIANEDLEKKQDPNLVQGLFHLAATGDCPPTLKEWLVDVLAERGHKRWDHAMRHGYTKVLELAHENLLPALDRCVAILSHLKGLAIYYEQSPVFSVSTSIISSILDTIRCLRLLAHQLLLFCSEELQRFKVFSKWLRREIDVQGSESANADNEEAEQDLNIDYSLLLAYVQGPLETSRLDPILSSNPGDADYAAHGDDMYEALKAGLVAFKKDGGDGNADRVKLINLNTYYNAWTRHNSTLVRQITSHQRETSIIPLGINIQAGKLRAADLRVLCEEKPAANQESSGELLSTYTVAIPGASRDRIDVTRVLHWDDVENWESIQRIEKSEDYQLPGVELLDAKFADDEQIILLARQSEQTHLLSLPYRGPNAAIDLLDVPTSSYDHFNITNIASAVHGKDGEKAPRELAWRSLVKHTFTPEDRISPRRIEVNGRQDRRFIVILGDDDRSVRILDLDSTEEEKTRYMSAAFGSNDEAGLNEGDDGMSE